MAYTAALVDRARLRRTQKSRDKVEGATRSSPVSGPWFKVRLQMVNTPETNVDPGSRPRIVQRPSLLVARRDEQGEDVEIRAGDKIEVDSRQLGRETYEVASDPEPLRRKRRVMGWQVDVKRVADHDTVTP